MPRSDGHVILKPRHRRRVPNVASARASDELAAVPAKITADGARASYAHVFQFVCQYVGAPASPAGSLPCAHFPWSAATAQPERPISRNIARRDVVLLLYALLEENAAFRAYVFARPDPQTLVRTPPVMPSLRSSVPLTVRACGSRLSRPVSPRNQLVPTLRVLYGAMVTKLTEHTFVYLLLILFLILTEDAGFNDRLQTIVRQRHGPARVAVRGRALISFIAAPAPRRGSVARGCHGAAFAQIVTGIDWYKEGNTRDPMPLSSLVYLVLTRALLHNLQEQKDVYLQTTCLASLANLAPHLRQLHPTPASKLVR